MGKKIMNALTFLIVLGACIVMTVYIGKGSVSTMTYNFVFLGIMTVLYLAGLFMGMFRVDSIAQALKRGTEELAGISMERKLCFAADACTMTMGLLEPVRMMSLRNGGSAS